MKIAIDPFGKNINIPEKLCDVHQQPFDISNIFDDVQDVIKKPAMVFETVQTATEFYYFRSVGWDYVLLIGAHKQNEDWIAYQCIINPDAGYMADIFTRCRQLL